MLSHTFREQNVDMLFFREKSISQNIRLAKKRLMSLKVRLVRRLVVQILPTKLAV